MKRVLFIIAAMLLAGTGFAQTDSAAKASDTVKVGNFIIIKKNKNGTTPAEVTTPNSTSNNRTFEYKVERRSRRRSNVSTNWFIFDLGFANYRDNTNYATAQTGPYLKTLVPGNGPVTQSTTNLITGKSSNVNIWFFMQKLNVIKHVVNLKYGLGLEMYNFRYDQPISFRKDPSPYAFIDSVPFSKNKLYVSYLTVPFMLNINTTPDSRRGLSFSAGFSAGYRVEGRNKQISDARGKQKISGDFNFEPWRIAAIGEIGLGPVRLYGSYSLNRLQKDVTKVEQYPYAIGIRFSNW